MIKKIKMKSMVFTTLIIIFFTGCGFSTKAVGINNNLNVQHIDSLSNQGLGYCVSMSYIGQVELNDKNVELINKSINELYQSVKQIDTYSAKGYDVLVDKCGEYKNAKLQSTNASSLKQFAMMERECRRLYALKESNPIQNEKRVSKKGFHVEKPLYPDYYKLSLKDMGTGRMYDKNKPLPTGITHTLKVTDYDVMVGYSRELAPFGAHISFIPIDSKLNIFINYTSLNSPKKLIKFTIGDEDEQARMVDIKNEFYTILEKNGLKIDENKEVSFPEFDLSSITFGVHKVIGN